MDHDEIRRLRIALGWTQQELAHELGVTSNTVARWEQQVHAMPGPAVKYLSLLATRHGIRSARKAARARVVAGR